MSNLNPKFVDEIKSFDEELYSVANNVIGLAYKEDGALDLKTKLLIAIALDALSGAKGGVTSLAKKAQAEGATKEEIKEAIRLAYFISGMKVISAATGAMD